MLPCEYLEGLNLDGSILCILLGGMLNDEERTAGCDCPWAFRNALFELNDSRLFVLLATFVGQFGA